MAHLLRLRAKAISAGITNPDGPSEWPLTILDHGDWPLFFPFHRFIGGDRFFYLGVS